MERLPAIQFCENMLALLPASRGGMWAAEGASPAANPKAAAALDAGVKGTGGWPEEAPGPPGLPGWGHRGRQVRLQGKAEHPKTLASLPRAGEKAAASARTTKGEDLGESWGLGLSLPPLQAWNPPEEILQEPLLPHSSSHAEKPHS